MRTGPYPHCANCPHPHDALECCIHRRSPAAIEPGWLPEGNSAIPSHDVGLYSDVRGERTVVGCQQMTRESVLAHLSSLERKATPIATGVLDYFPLALAAIARLSKQGNDKHNPGESLHRSREKSIDHADCIARHLIERGTVEPESGELHETCLAWRALALLQLAEEKRLVSPASIV